MGYLITGQQLIDLVENIENDNITFIPNGFQSKECLTRSKLEQAFVYAGVVKLKSPHGATGTVYQANQCVVYDDVDSIDFNNQYIMFLSKNSGRYYFYEEQEIADYTLPTDYYYSQTRQYIDISQPVYEIESIIDSQNNVSEHMTNECWYVGFERVNEFCVQGRYGNEILIDAEDLQNAQLVSIKQGSNSIYDVQFLINNSEDVTPFGHGVGSSEPFFQHYDKLYWDTSLHSQSFDEEVFVNVFVLNENSSSNSS